MQATRNAAWLALVLAMTPLLAPAQQTDSERRNLARYEQYAQAPVDSLHYFRIDGFEYLAPDRLAVWFGVNKLYLLTVDQPCNNLAYANAISLSAKNRTLYANSDFVQFDHQRCRITRIVPVDERQMKKDRAAGVAPAPAGSS